MEYWWYVLIHWSFKIVIHLIFYKYYRFFSNNWKLNVKLKWALMELQNQLNKFEYFLTVMMTNFLLMNYFLN